VRNGARDIAATLASVAAQDYPDIEHIIVDGASTDDTVEIVRRMGQRVARLVSEPDTGVYDAFNKGLRLATGDVVAYLNAGDSYVSPGIVGSIANSFAASDVEAVYGDVEIVDAVNPAKLVRRYRSGSFRPSWLAWGFMPAHPALFIRRSVYQRCGGYDPSYRVAGDFELCIRLFAVEQIRHIYVPQLLVRMPRGGLSNSGWPSVWTITREMRRACTVHGVRTSYARLLMRLPVKTLEFRWHRS
jgi:glycosyltransferase involved in cell wall biosynthesis